MFLDFIIGFPIHENQKRPKFLPCLVKNSFLIYIIYSGGRHL